MKMKIKMKGSLESNLCDYSDAYILAISFYKIWTIS